MRLACYDPGSRHLGEVCIEAAEGHRPRCLLAGHVTVDLSDDGLAALAKRLREGWLGACVQRVVLERVSGLGAGPDASTLQLRSMATALIGAARVASLIQGLALALDLPVVTYPPRTVRAGLRVEGKSGAVELVKASLDGWHIEGEAAPEGAAGDWYHHAYDAALAGLWDLETRARPAPQKASRREGAKPKVSAAAAKAARLAVGCKCGRKHLRECPLCTTPRTYRKRVDVISSEST